MRKRKNAIGINILAFITLKILIANLFKTSHRVLYQTDTRLWWMVVIELSFQPKEWILPFYFILTGNIRNFITHLEYVY